MIKLLLKKIIPEIIIKKILFFLMKIKSFKTRKIFKKAVKNNIYLKEEDLSILQTKYDYPPEYGYNKEDLLLRGKERATEYGKWLDVGLALHNTNSDKLIEQAKYFKPK